MIPFEIHITADGPAIHEAAKKLGYKTIEIQLLRPSGQYIRTEHMTSVVSYQESDCDAYDKLHKIWSDLTNAGITVVRRKLECPPLSQFKNKAVYLESHFMTGDFLFPTSQNIASGKLLATARTSNRDKFDTFLGVFRKDRIETEYCLFDSNQAQDEDWFAYWNYR